MIGVGGFVLVGAIFLLVWIALIEKVNQVFPCIFGETRRGD